ncbi:MAG: efflux RND transporter periplasmic adaptor subunit [Gammaproteobacteria bacterium]|nr:MAG: efflux RND transporter periplasmic adaptor subunit [Gammaproteobacteria bacterium]
MTASATASSGPSGGRAVWRRRALACLAALAGALPAAPVPAAPAAARAPVPVTVQAAQLRPVEEVVRVVGTVRSKGAPVVAAEVPGRVVQVAVEVGDTVERGQLLAALDDRDARLARDRARADIRRLKALLKAQELQVRRYRGMLRKKFIPQSVLDEAVAQRDALREELAAARAALADAELRLSKVRILAPVAGRVEARLVAEGDYVKVGTPLFRLTTARWLRAELAFPERLAGRIRPGLAVRLRSPAAPGQPVSARLSEVRAGIDPASLALLAYVELENPGRWRPGASVDAEAVLAVRPRAVVVPEAAVVLRPRGQVVYQVAGGRAVERMVRTGVHLDGLVEIREGLPPGAEVVVDGAGFLSDGARVAVQAPVPGRGGAAAGGPEAHAAGEAGPQAAGPEGAAPDGGTDGGGTQGRAGAAGPRDGTGEAR